MGEEDLQKEKSSQSQWKEWYHSRELIFERKKRKKKGGEEEQQPQKGLIAEPKTKLSIQNRS